MNNDDKVKRFLETPFDLKIKSDESKTVVIVLGVMVIVFAIIGAIAIEPQFGLIIFGVIIPFVLIYYLIVWARSLKNKSFTRKIYSLGLDKEIEKGNVLSANAKICLTEDYIIYNDYHDISGPNGRKYSIRSFYIKTNDITKIINKSVYGTSVCILCVGSKEYPIRLVDFNIVSDYITKKSSNKNIEIVHEETKDNNSNNAKDDIYSKNHPFKHEIYGEINAHVEKLEDKYSGASVTFNSQDKKLYMIVGLPKNNDPVAFLEEDNLKKQVLNYYYEFITNNLEECKKYFVEKEYEHIYDWITGDDPDIETNEFYTKNKTKEEFKKVLLDKMELDVERISIDSDCKICGISFSPSLNKYHYVLTLAVYFDVVDGKAKLDSMFADYIS